MMCTFILNHITFMSVDLFDAELCKRGKGAPGEGQGWWDNC